MSATVAGAATGARKLTDARTVHHYAEMARDAAPADEREAGVDLSWRLFGYSAPDLDAAEVSR